jgi:hypothetical protein
MMETPKQAALRLVGAAIRGGWDLEALHEYTYASGQPWYWRMRVRLADGSKWIRPMRVIGQTYELGEPEFRKLKPLYLLHELAAKPGSPVWFVEGEVCAEALCKLAVLATTAGAANSDERADFRPLAGRAATLWPDNDAPGIEHAERVAAKLRGLGCAVELIDARGLVLPDGGDVVDWLRTNPSATAADLAKLPRVRSTERSPVLLVEDHAAPSVKLICGADLRPERINWLWEGWLARGKFHMCAGAPGTGKTTIMLALAATVSVGGRWPDGTRCAAGNVVIWSGEDDPQDTLLPRFLAMGGDRRRVYFVGDVSANGATRPFDPARDMEALAGAASSITDVALIGVDPIVNAVGGDSNKNAETRRSLQPIVDLAANLNAAALGVSHFSKGTAGRDPVERITGSIAFGALPRLVFAAARKPDDQGGGRMFVRAKSNIGPDGGGFGYDLQQGALPDYPEIVASRVLWGDALDGTARQLLAEAEPAQGEDDGNATDHAERFLLDALRGGRVLARDVKRQGDLEGITPKALRRARERLRVEVEREGFGSAMASYWRLPIRAQSCPPEDRARMGTTDEKGTTATQDTEVL